MADLTRRDLVQRGAIKFKRRQRSASKLEVVLL